MDKLLSFDSIKISWGKNMSQKVSVRPPVISIIDTERTVGHL